MNPAPFDLKAYDPTSILETPNIDRIARDGLILDGAHQQEAWAGAVCRCSRTMIMTGRTLWHIPGAEGKKNKSSEFIPKGIEDFTLAAVFNKAGYDTVRTCKNGNSYEAANKKFTIRHDATKRGGTAETGSEWHGDQVMNYLDDRETQLFNLAKNPNEFLPEHHKTDPMLTDLAENPEYATKLAEMEALLLYEMKRLNDPYKLWNQPK